MSRRLIDTARPFGPFGKPGHVAKIYRDSDWNEYQVDLYIDNVKQPDATYHTDDKQDAINTAVAMIH